MEQIEKIRQDIDIIDAEIRTLIMKRVGLIKQIGILKNGSGTPVRDKVREMSQSHQIIKACEDAGHPELAVYMLLVFRMIIEGSVRLQGGDKTDLQGSKYCIICEWKTHGLTEAPLNWPLCPRCHMPLIIAAA